MADFTSSTTAVPEVGSVPRHVAIIMDGNGRWATSRKLPRFAGHVRGVEAVRRVVEACHQRGVGHLTLFAFSSENWRRPPDEVALLMRLFIRTLQRELNELAARGIRLRVVGDIQAFEPRLRDLIIASTARAPANERMVLTVAANYGGRWDILQAMRRMLIAHPELAANPAAITEPAFEPYLAMAGLPEPDLFIRTGGEQRISNFLLWQLAYTELYFTDTYWPDFDGASIDAAFASYRQRERRFGRTSAQLGAGQ
ncbi:MAG: polyprenyl diphosphate synthase [Burkholderiales bacterium]|jgi:undecaprenyl diphosphate synthase